MVERRDYLPVCNDQGTPLPDFQAMFCVRCVQPECSRSRAGGLFETRVATWEERLFNAPPRMPKDDPLYSLIAAKRFIEIDGGRIPEVDGRSAWVDPRVLEDPVVPAPKPRPAKPAKVEVTPKVDGAPPVMVAKPEVRRQPLNTPFMQGVVLKDSGGPTSPKRPADPWAPPVSGPAPSSDGDGPIVKAGAIIKFE